jgi:hypothetical protein
MKASDIITQLRRSLPGLTNLFSDEVTISTLSKTGSTVTATTSSAHGLSIGDYVYVVGAARKTPVASITRSGAIASATTSSPHDLTEVWHPTVEITGADQAEYNGTSTLLSANTRNTFTFTVDSGATTPATGTMFLLEPYRRGFNGWVQVATVPDTTTFTYSSDDSFTASAQGDMKVRKLPRISGALSVDRAVEAYTRMNQDNFWGFVVLGDVTASRDRYNFTDAIATHTTGSMFRQVLLNNIDFYVFVPTKDTLSGRLERDVMTDVSTYLYKSLLGRTYSTYLVDEPATVLNFASHGVFVWNNGFYVHRFSFETTTELTKNDVTEPEFTRAFRDVEFDFNNQGFGEEILSTNVNLDDEL